jgi:branched-chain amino acid transport system substrate-binding protein
MSLLRRILLVSALGALASCGRAAGTTVKFGAAGPENDPNGAANRKGVELALDEINHAKGHAFHFEPVFRNDSAKGDRAAIIAQEFVNDPGIIAVIGHVNSGAMMAAARIYDGHLPAVATAATSPALSGISPWTFRVISSDSLNGLSVAQHMSRLAKRRAVILYEDNAYGRGLAESFRRGFTGEIIGMDPVSDQAGEDLEPFITWIKQKQADLVFVAGTATSGIAFLQEARRQRLDAAFAGGNGWATLVDNPLAEGAEFPTPFNAQDSRPAVKAFVDAYRAKYGEAPSAYAALAYDATKLLAQAVDKVGPDRIKVRDYLAHLPEPYDGVTGAITFGANGDPTGKTMVMAHIHDRTIQPEIGQ